MQERQLLDLALENLENSSFLKAKCLKEKPLGDLDAVITIGHGMNTIKLLVEVKSEIRSHQLPQIERWAQQFDNFMLVAGHIYPKVKEELRRQDIPYLETNGNIYLHREHFYIWIEKHKPNKAEKEKLNRAFTKTGLKVVFHFLRYEEEINQPYRAIAEATKTALGNVPNVLNGLKDLGFLLKLNNQEYVLQNKKELFEKWLLAYEQTLKPSLEIGTFRFLKPEDFQEWKNLPLKNGKSWWGAEPAADIYTNYLKPEVLTIYTLETRNELIKHYRLLPDPKGNVRVYQKFWEKDEVNDNVVPPHLIYADLINTGDRRCREAAEKIYHELLQDKL